MSTYENYVIIKKSNLSSIANIVREKTKTSEGYKPSELPDAIDSIVKIDDYLKMKMAGTLTKYSNENILNVPSYMFVRCDTLSDISLYGCEKIGNNAFQSCASLTNVSLPECIDIGDYAFQKCSSLVNINLSKCITINKSAFEDCVSLQEAAFQSCTEIKSNAFRRNRMLRQSRGMGNKTR